MLTMNLEKDAPYLAKKFYPNRHIIHISLGPTIRCHAPAKSQALSWIALYAGLAKLCKGGVADWHIKNGCTLGFVCPHSDKASIRARARRHAQSIQYDRFTSPRFARKRGQALV